MADSRDGAENIQDGHVASYSVRKQESVKEAKKEGMPKGHRSQPKRAPNGQSWNKYGNLGL